MGWLDKILGRGKQTGEEGTGSASGKLESAREEAGGAAESGAQKAEEMGQEARERVDEERR